MTEIPAEEAQELAETPPEVSAQSAQTGYCGAKALLSVGGVDVSAEKLCPYHWRLKHGDQDYKPPFVLEP